jgi:hypothetical protein
MMLFEDPSTKLDMVSSPCITIPAGQSLSVDYNFTEFRYVTGAEYFRKNGNFEDRLHFQMVHPLLGVVDQFATSIHLQKDYGFYQFYRANVPAGLIARAVYFNNGTEEAKFCFNLITHKDK